METVPSADPALAISSCLTPLFSLAKTNNDKPSEANSTQVEQSPNFRPTTQFDRSIPDRLLRCLPGQTRFECTLDKTLLITNFVAFALLVYLIFSVYCYSRRKSADDYRVIVMAIAFINSIFVTINELLLPF